MKRRKKKMISQKFIAVALCAFLVFRSVNFPIGKMVVSCPRYSNTCQSEQSEELHTDCLTDIQCSKPKQSSNLFKFFKMAIIAYFNGSDNGYPPKSCKIHLESNCSFHSSK